METHKAIIDSPRAGEVQPPNIHSTFQVKAILYHLNGKTSEITMNVPKYTNWLEPFESAFIEMESYVIRLAASFVQISHFDLVTLTHKPNGEPVECFLKKTVKIPLGKVYDTKSKKWLTLEEVKENGLENYL